MKNSPRNIGLLLVTIAVVSVGFTYATVTGFHDNQITGPQSGALMIGNVEVRVFDEDGSISAYRQTGNHIVVSGMELLASQLFNDTRGGTVGVSGGGYGNANAWENFTNVNPLKYMEIGNGSTALAFDDYELDAELSKTGDAFSPNCDRITAIINNGTDSLGIVEQAGESDDGGTNLAQINITAIATFDGADCFANNIHEAGLWTGINATGGPLGGADTGWMFARNTFGFVDLTSSDSLELTWTFTFTDCC